MVVARVAVIGIVDFPGFARQLLSLIDPVGAMDCCLHLHPSSHGIPNQQLLKNNYFMR